MALTRDFRETVQARVQKDEKFRRGLLRDAIEALLAGENELVVSQAASAAADAMRCESRRDDGK